MQCSIYADTMNTVLASCGRKSAVKPNKGFSCIPAFDNDKESVFGTVASAKDCKGLVRFITKALKKIQSRPAVKFVCEVHAPGFLRVKVKAARKCDDYLARTNALLQLHNAGDFVKCTLKTTTTPKPPPPTDLGCLRHHNPEVATTVLQSSEPTCPGQVSALNAILKSCTYLHV